MAEAAYNRRHRLVRGVVQGTVALVAGLSGPVALALLWRFAFAELMADPPVVLIAAAGAVGILLCTREAALAEYGEWAAGWCWLAFAAGAVVAAQPLLL